MKIARVVFLILITLAALPRVVYAEEVFFYDKTGKEVRRCVSFSQEESLREKTDMLMEQLLENKNQDVSYVPEDMTLEGIGFSTRENAFVNLYMEREIEEEAWANFLTQITNTLWSTGQINSIIICVNGKLTGEFPKEKGNP
ncbi:MAG: GerMN domain-containing protein [Clostridiales bacterium]|nr:GerMN domain-containing protein [Clostridiales bacterium]